VRLKSVNPTGASIKEFQQRLKFKNFKLIKLVEASFDFVSRCETLLRINY